jgi:glycerol-3-phosphate dehydrogenase
MAADAVDVASEQLGGKAAPSPTKRLRLVGSEGFEPPAATLEPAEHDHLAGRYGSEAGHVLDLVRADPMLGEPLVPGLPYLKAEARFAVRHEMACTLSDVLDRRTRARLLDRDATAAAAASVAALMAPDLAWSDDRVTAEVTGYCASIALEREQWA